MKLLVLTQKVDKNDDVLGFFHGWLKALAGRFQQITVICLQKGQYDLPANIQVLSLGKEIVAARIEYLANFYRFIWQKRKDYDAVFVHMNDEYVILGGLLWKIWGKKIYLWRNHIKGSWRARVAVWLSYRVFSTSPYSFIARYRKNRLMPAGIDTSLFQPDPALSVENNSIFYLGRISPVKKIDIFIEALAVLKHNSIDFKSYIIGDPPIRDQAYLAKLKDQADRHGLSGCLFFRPSAPYSQVPGICRRYKVVVNMTNSGSLDKAVLEAMACGCLPIISNLSFRNILPAELMFIEGDADDLAEKIKSALLLNPEDMKLLIQDLRQYVETNHSLTVLIDELMAAFEN